MNYQQFKDKFLGRGIDFDKAYKNQCVDVYRQYCQEFGFPQSPPVRGAVNIWDTYLTKHFERITNTPKGIPDQGDVIIWGTTVGSFGHCAIFDHGDVNNFVSLDQNWPFDNGEGVLHEQKHNYKGVLGWLRPKLSPEEPKKPVIEIPVAKIENYSEKNHKSLTGITPMIRELHDFIPKWQKEMESANKKAVKLAKDILTIDEERKNFQRLYKEKLDNDISKATMGQLLSAIFVRLNPKKSG